MQTILRNGIAWLTLAGAAMFAHADTVARAVGGTSIQVPVPPGFVEVTDLAMLDFARKNTLSNARLLAVFVTEADDERIRAGIGPAMQRYFMLQVSRAAEPLKLTRSHFAQVKQSIRTQMSAAAAQALPRVNRELRDNHQDEPVQTEVKNLVADGVFFETDAAIGVVLFGEVQFTAAERSETTRMVTAATTALAREKLVYFYAYAPAADSAWARGAAQDWAAQLERANR